MHYSDVDKHFEEARQRALNALKTSFSKQRNKGLLSDEAVTVLRQAVDSVQNDPTSCQECFFTWNSIYNPLSPLYCFLAS